MVLFATMRKQWTERRTGRRSSALIACAVALFVALHGLLAPIATASHAAHPAGGPSVSAFADTEICNKGDIGDPSDHARYNRHDCCILCQASARDATLLGAIAWAAAWIASAPDASPSAPDYPEPEGARPPSIGWASSWSSRAPPSFS